MPSIARNSAITQVRAEPDAVALDVLAHYATGSIAVPQPGTPPGAPLPIGAAHRCPIRAACS